MNKQKSQSGNALLILIVVLMVALLGALGYISWRNYTQTKSVVAIKNNVSTPKSTTTVTPGNSPDAKTIVTGAYNLVNNKYASSNLKITSTLDTAGSPTYKPSGANYYVTTYGSLLDVSKIIKTRDDNIDIAIALDVNNFLISNNLTKDDNKVTCGIGNMACYQSSTIICGSSSDGSDSDLGWNFSLDCANISDFSSAQSIVEPFAQAYSQVYLSSHPEYVNDATYGVPVIKKSLVAGYQYAEVTLHQMSMGLFYKKDGENWKYFIGIQSPVCNIFNTDELKAAFSGFKCSDVSGNMITLTPDYK